MVDMWDLFMCVDVGFCGFVILNVQCVCLSELSTSLLLYMCVVGPMCIGILLLFFIAQYISSFVVYSGVDAWLRCKYKVLVVYHNVKSDLIS